MTVPRTASDMVTEAKQRIENLTVDQIAEERADRGVVLVDIRESEEIAQHGRIPGAIHLPRGMLEFYADPTSAYHREQLSPEKRVILHCAAGGRSALAVRTLQEMGYTNVAHLDGGFTAWKQAGEPVDEIQLGR
jgi:rhodanese-related sulfurtransferase